MKKSNVFEFQEKHLYEHLITQGKNNLESSIKPIGSLNEDDVNILKELINTKSNNMEILVNDLLVFFHNHSLIYHRFFIETELFPHFIDSINNIPIPSIFCLLSYLISGSETLAISSIKQGILTIIYRVLELPAFDYAPTIHSSLKLVRKMIITGPTARAFLFAAGFFHHLYVFFLTKGPLPHFTYISHTLFLFIQGSVSHNFSTFEYVNHHSRKDLINQWKEIQHCSPSVLNQMINYIPSSKLNPELCLKNRYEKSILIFTNFLKYGNSFQINRQLWKTLFFFIPGFVTPSPNLTQKTVLYAYKSFTILAHNVSYIKDFFKFSTVPFLHADRNFFYGEGGNLNVELILAYYSAISELIFHSSPLQFKCLEKENVFQDAYSFLTSNDHRLQILAIRILTNGFEKDEAFISHLLFSSDFSFFLQALNLATNAPFNLKSELCWFLIILLNSLSEQQRISILSPDLIQFLLGVAQSSGDELKVVTLELFIKSFSENDVFVKMCQDPIFFSDIEEFSQSENPKIHDYAFKLLSYILEKKQISS